MTHPDDPYRGQNPALVERIADALFDIDSDPDRRGGLAGRSFLDVAASLLIALPELADRVTISACRGTTTDPAAANTAATTAPHATHTSPHSNSPEPASAPNPSASNARG